MTEEEFYELIKLAYQKGLIDGAANATDQTGARGAWVPEACRSCHNHPSNGGSGICFCTLGTPEIT